MATCSCLLWLAAAVFLLASATEARAIPSPDPSPLSAFEVFPSRNMTGGPAGEIKCYALPYGGLGIFSHVLTFHTIAWVSVGHRPLWPFHRMTAFYKFDLFLAGLTVLSSLPLASFAIHRCRLSWHFVLLALWKLTTTLSTAAITIHRCIIMRREAKQPPADAGISLSPLGRRIQKARSSVWTSLSASWLNPHRHPPQRGPPQSDTNPHWFRREPRTHPRDIAPLRWLALYLLGTVLGAIGLGPLVAASFANADVKHLTYGFGTVMVVIPMTVTGYWYAKHLELPQGGWRVLVSAYLYGAGGAVLAFVASFCVFAPLYSDLVLGAIAGKWSGLPSAEFAPLYWAWFAVLRLPLLAF